MSFRFYADSVTSTTGTKQHLGYADLAELLSLMAGDEKHDPAALSTLDVLWVLYDSVLDVAAGREHDPGRDRFLLSKGHGPQAYFAVLAAKGFFPVEWLSTFGRYDSPLGYHPDRRLVPGVEISSGSLGHGLGLAVGVVLALRAGRGARPPAADRSPGDTRLGGPRVFCLLGDAELDEGSNAEAIAFAGRAHLGELTAIVVDNQSATHGWPGGIERRFSLEGWASRRVDGRDHDAIATALGGRPGRGDPRRGAGRPRVVVARVEPKGGVR